MFATIFLAAAAAAGCPSVDKIEPTILEAFRPVELTIVGEGFGPDCRVLIGAAGRMVPVRHEPVSGNEIRGAVFVGLDLRIRPPDQVDQLFPPIEPPGPA